MDFAVDAINDFTAHAPRTPAHVEDAAHSSFADHLEPELNERERPPSGKTPLDTPALEDASAPTATAAAMPPPLAPQTDTQTAVLILNLAPQPAAAAPNPLLPTATPPVAPTGPNPATPAPAIPDQAGEPTPQLASAASAPAGVSAPSVPVGAETQPSGAASPALAPQQVKTASPGDQNERTPIQHNLPAPSLPAQPPAQEQANTSSSAPTQPTPAAAALIANPGLIDQNVGAKASPAARSAPAEGLTPLAGENKSGEAPKTAPVQTPAGGPSVAKAAGERIAQATPHAARDAFTPVPAFDSAAPSAQSATQALQSAPNTSSTHTDHAAAARETPAALQVGREIIRRFDGGATRFELRLDPPELGRVDVRLEVSRDRRVSAVIAADSPQALAELARHARDLEQSLQSAGLELAEDGLSFDLRQGGERSAESESGREGAAASDPPGADAAANTTEPAAVRARPFGLERWVGVRVDLSV